MAAFDYGNRDKHITAPDADGVALAAIQGLYAMQPKNYTNRPRSTPPCVGTTPSLRDGSHA